MEGKIPQKNGLFWSFVSHPLHFLPPTCSWAATSPQLLVVQLSSQCILGLVSFCPFCTFSIQPDICCITSIEAFKGVEKRRSCCLMVRGSGDQCCGMKTDENYQQEWDHANWWMWWGRWVSAGCYECDVLREEVRWDERFMHEEWTGLTRKGKRKRKTYTPCVVRSMHLLRLPASPCVSSATLRRLPASPALTASASPCVPCVACLYSVVWTNSSPATSSSFSLACPPPPCQLFWGGCSSTSTPWALPSTLSPILPASLLSPLKLIRGPYHLF